MKLSAKAVISGLSNHQRLQIISGLMEMFESANDEQISEISKAVKFSGKTYKEFEEFLNQLEDLKLIDAEKAVVLKYRQGNGCLEER
jgi:hypothetical protein